MIYDFPRFKEIMNRLVLTPNQIYFCILLLEQDFYKKKEMFEEYAEKHGGFRWLEIEDLEQKGYITNFSDNEIPKTIGIIKTRKGELKLEQVKDATILEMLVVTPYFKDKIYIDAEAAAEELLTIYPAWMMIKGKRTALKMIGNREEFYQYYNNLIQGDILKHKTIVEAFSHFKRLVGQNKVTGMGIKKALEGRLWEDITELIEIEEIEKGVIKGI